MGARQKLNGAYLMGNFILAVLLGGVTGSLILGVIAFAVGLGCSLAGEEIRLVGRPGPSGGHSKKGGSGPRHG